MSQPPFVPFEEAEHTADLALVARGRDLRELIVNACRGTIALIGETEGLAAEEWVAIEASAEEPERLLVRFVKELLAEWESRGGLPVAVEVDEPSGVVGARTSCPHAEASELRGRVGFAHPTDLDDRIRGLPKAATYHDLHIRQEGDLLEVRLILDV